jgi:hypothetical protein
MILAVGSRDRIRSYMGFQQVVLKSPLAVFQVPSGSFQIS